MNSLVPSRASRALSDEDLRRSAPPVFAKHARPGVSARYTFVFTAQVVALLGAEGWPPSSYPMWPGGAQINRDVLNLSI